MAAAVWALGNVSMLSLAALALSGGLGIPA